MINSLQKWKRFNNMLSIKYPKAAMHRKMQLIKKECSQVALPDFTNEEYTTIQNALKTKTITTKPKSTQERFLSLIDNVNFIRGAPLININRELSLKIIKLYQHLTCYSDLNQMMLREYKNEEYLIQIGINLLKDDIEYTLGKYHKIINPEDDNQPILGSTFKKFENRKEIENEQDTNELPNL